MTAELAHEQAHVDRVYERFAEAERQAAELAREGLDRGLIDHDGGVKEEHFRGLYERDVLVYAAARRIGTLNAEHEGLVFGRLDQLDGEIRYIGRLGVRDEQHEPLVIDWRAPAAAPFYQATPVDPAGVIRRRVLRCSGPRVIGISDDLLDPDAAPADLPTVGEGALLAAMSQARGSTMRAIVATIQAEQDRAIRAATSGTTTISGGPGTGKTVVALHRAAYLLYRQRRRFEGGGVLVVGPSPTFMRYIERVLPSLGEQTVTLRSIGAVVTGLDASRHDEPAVAAVKGSLRMLTVLRRAVRDAPPGAPDHLRVFYRDRALRLDQRQLSTIRRTVLSGQARHNTARSRAVHALLTSLWRQAIVDSPAKLDRSAFDDDLADRPAFVSFVQRWWPTLDPDTVLERLRDPRTLARYAGGVLSKPEQALLLGSWQRHDDLSISDVALVDEIVAQLGPVPRARRRPVRPDGLDEAELLALAGLDVPPDPADEAEDEEYAHVLVDEAQDLSPMQWRMLGRRGRYASWTVVGDPAQSSWADPVEARQAMDRTLPKPRHEFRLGTNYRNSAEVFALAAAVIRGAVPDADVPHAVRSTGRQPEHRLVPATELADATRAAVADLLASVPGSVGVITPVDLRDEVTAWLAGVGDDRLAVVTGPESKGMEYDGVVAVEPDRIVDESPAGTRTLYVVLSRATQHLITVGASADWRPAQ